MQLLKRSKKFSYVIRPRVDSPATLNSGKFGLDRLVSELEAGDEYLIALRDGCGSYLPYLPRVPPEAIGAPDR